MMNVKRCRLLGLAAFVVFALPVLYAGVEDRLWRAYSEGPPEKQAILNECLDRMDDVRHKAMYAVEPPDWSKDADVQWLVSHRTPARLVVERELRRQPEGFYVDALLFLTPALDNGQLQQYLPELLWAARNDRSRLQVLRSMAEIRGAESLAALERFLMVANKNTPEELICEAVRGLGLARKAKYRPALVHASTLVRSDEALLRVEAARYLCGELGMAQEILRTLEKEVNQGKGDEDKDPALRLLALDFFVQNPVEDAVPVLADLAANSKEKEVADRAFMALVNSTGLGVPLAEELEQPTSEPSPGETPREGVVEIAELRLMLEREFGDLTKQERKKVVDAVLQWWAENPGRAPQPVGPIDPKEALAEADKSRPH